MPGARMLKMVVMKLIAPRIEDAPARCSERIAKSMAGPVWAVVESGAYTVQPAPTPGSPPAPGTNSDVTSRSSEAGSSQNEMLFMRGNAMSGAPIMIGTNQLPNPPISAGMIMKNTMISPCAVMNTLKVWPLEKICIPGCASSSRIPIESMPPMKPAVSAKIR
jgi:hypothetical protein